MPETTAEFVKRLRDEAHSLQESLFVKAIPAEFAELVGALLDAARIIEEQAAALKPMVGVSDAATPAKFMFCAGCRHNSQSSNEYPCDSCRASNFSPEREGAADGEA